MVFSQTSQKTHSVLKVVEIDRLKANKSQQVNGLIGVVDRSIDSSVSAPQPTTSYSEILLKPEPLFEETMFHESDCEYFQDLVQWCFTPAKEEQVPTIDSSKANEERAPHTKPLNTPSSPKGWDVFDANSFNVQAGFYNTTPKDPLSPNVDNYVPVDKFQYPTLGNDKKQFEEQFLDISSLPVVIDLASDATEASPWRPMDLGWSATHNIDYTKPTQTNTMPFIDQDDSLDLKMVSVIPREVEGNDVVVSEYVLNNESGQQGLLEMRGESIGGPYGSGGGGLTVNVAMRPSWPADVISTPEVLSYVEQLEKEKLPDLNEEWPAVTELITTDTCPVNTSPPEYEPITPKSESHQSSDDDVQPPKRRRHDSEDSDETYTPYQEEAPRKYKRRKPNIPIQDMIRALQGSQQLPKARRGRPPKRRESTVSSVCSVDDSSSISVQESKYRMDRDKNNEASKRSRMNKKLKELQMEQLAEELEEKNKRLQVRVDILEDMKKMLKDSLMGAILQNK